MREKKHIDRLFQEKFKDFEVSPNKSVWKNIERELKSKKRKSFIVPWWYKIAGAAAILTLIFLAGNLIFTNFEKIPIVKSEPSEKLSPSSDKILQKEIETNQSIVSEDNSERTINREKPISSGDNIIFIEPQKQVSGQAEDQKKLNGITKSGDNPKVRVPNSIAKDSEKEHLQSGKNPRLNEISEVKKPVEGIAENKTDYKKTISTDEEGFDNSKKVAVHSNVQTKTANNSGLVKTDIENNNKKEISSDETIPATKEKEKSLLEVAAQQKEEKILENEENTELTNTNWQISPFAAPIYYGGFGSQNAIDPSLAQNESESEVTMSYGVNFSYKISERLKIRSGVGQVSMAYNTYDIAFATSVKSAVFSNVSYSSPTTDNLNIVPLKSIQSGQNSELLGRSPFTAGTLHQQIGFIEVPLEIEYALIDKQFGLSVIGGASTLFLNNNSLVINSENGRTNIGKMQNLNNVSFSTNIGLGLDYKISEQFDINLEPTFKYQINSFSGNNNGFKPYYFGIYTGIGFKF